MTTFHVMCSEQSLAHSKYLIWPSIVLEIILLLSLLLLLAWIPDSPDPELHAPLERCKRFTCARGSAL